MAIRLPFRWNPSNAMHEHPHDPLRPHAHDPNPLPPSEDAQFTLTWPAGSIRLAPADLAQLPAQTVTDCYIVSTGHGTSGPFAFQGVSLRTLIQHYVTDDWTQVAIISADGFGTRLYRSEVEALPTTRPALLAYTIDGRPLTRAEGLVRLIEPNERGDALRQVKWIAQIDIN